MVRIYTRTGDSGITALWGGQRVAKDDVRVEAYGTVDELNAVLGWVRCAVTDDDGALDQCLERLQQELFVLGSQLAATEAKSGSTAGPHLQRRHVQKLEQEIDDFNAQVPELAKFILPGGTELGARLHLARTVCRRAERRLISLDRQQKIDAVLLQYANRLSDWLFVAARLANHRHQAPEVEWLPASGTD